MSEYFTVTPTVIPPFVIQGPVRDGEGNVARTINFTDDLGASDGPGKIPALSDVTVTIARQDGQAIGANDVSLIPAKFTLDPTGLLLTVWFNVPAGLPYAVRMTQIVYVVTFQVNPTQGNQGYKRDGLLYASQLLG
jgi:hypothetical protein